LELKFSNFFTISISREDNAGDLGLTNDLGLGLTNGLGLGLLVGLGLDLLVGLGLGLLVGLGVTIGVAKGVLPDGDVKDPVPLKLRFGSVDNFWNCAI
jgi:hypothetical protein